MRIMLNSGRQLVVGRGLQLDALVLTILDHVDAREVSYPLIIDNTGLLGNPWDFLLAHSRGNARRIAKRARREATDDGFFQRLSESHEEVST